MIRRSALLLTLIALVTGCAGRPSLDDAEKAGSCLVLEEFFDGDLTAWGQFQDRFGDIRRSFVVDIAGEWDGDTLRLTEDFVYEDGTAEQRIWRLQKTGDATWRGHAAGVVGEASGEVRGNAFNFRYTIDLQTADGTMRADFDDWMWLLDDQTLVNRAYVSRFGFDLGEVLIFFRREEALNPSPTLSPNTRPWCGFE